MAPQGSRVNQKEGRDLPSPLAGEGGSRRRRETAALRVHPIALDGTVTTHETLAYRHAWSASGAPKQIGVKRACLWTLFTPLAFPAVSRGWGKELLESRQIAGRIDGLGTFAKLEVQLRRSDIAALARQSDGLAALDLIA